MLQEFFNPLSLLALSARYLLSLLIYVLIFSYFFIAVAFCSPSQMMDINPFDISGPLRCDSETSIPLAFSFCLFDRHKSRCFCMVLWTNNLCSRWPLTVRFSFFAPVLINILERTSPSSFCFLFCSVMLLEEILFVESDVCVFGAHFFQLKESFPFTLIHVEQCEENCLLKRRYMKVLKSFLYFVV